MRERLFVTINLEQQGAQAGREHFERTLRLYQRETIDLVNVGSLIDLDAQWPNLRAFKDAGRRATSASRPRRPRSTGSSKRSSQRERPDFVEINYSVTERDAERLLPMLSGPRHRRADQPAVHEWRVLRAAWQTSRCPSGPRNSSARAGRSSRCKYIFGNPAVTCVLTETTSAENMAENALAAFGAVPGRRARRRMRAFIDAV